MYNITVSHSKFQLFVSAVSHSKIQWFDSAFSYSKIELLALLPQIVKSNSVLHCCLMQLNLRIMNVFHSKSKSVWDRFVHSQTNSSNRRTDRQGHVGSQTTHATKILALFEPDIDSWQMWTRQFRFSDPPCSDKLGKQQSVSTRAQKHSNTYFISFWKWSSVTADKQDYVARQVLIDCSWAFLS